MKEIYKAIIAKQDEYIKKVDYIIGNWESSNMILTRIRREIAVLKAELEKEDETGIDKDWIFEIIDKTNVFAKQLIEDHFARHIEVYSRPECPFNYCDDPDDCKKLNKCHHT